MPTLYLAHDTCSRAVQVVANELELDLELVHVDLSDKSTSNGDDFFTLNPLAYVPLLALDGPGRITLSETIVIAAWLADRVGGTGLAPPPGSVERAKLDELLVFVTTEIAQKHGPLMRGLLTPDGVRWSHERLRKAYGMLDQRLADGRTWLCGDAFTIADAYVFGTWWHTRSGVGIDHLERLARYKARLDARPSVRKALQDEAQIAALHRAARELAVGREAYPAAGCRT